MDITLGSRTLALSEAKSLFQNISHALMVTQPRDLSEKSILKIAPFRRDHLAQYTPWSDLRGLDKAQRLTEVIDILIEMGVFVPLSVKETIEELGEAARNTGSFVRVVNIHRLKHLAGIDVPSELPSNGMQGITRQAPHAYDVFMAEQRVVLPHIEAA